MTIGSSLAGWWSAWKWVAMLVVALALSVWGNLLQWRAAATAPLRGQVAGLEDALDDSAALLESANARAAVIAAAGDQVVADAKAARDAYAAARRAQPLAPNCAMGAGRRDAINRSLGAKPEAQP